VRQNGAGSLTVVPVTDEVGAAAVAGGAEPVAGAGECTAGLRGVEAGGQARHGQQQQRQAQERPERLAAGSQNRHEQAPWAPSPFAEGASETETAGRAGTAGAASAGGRMASRTKNTA